MRVPFAATAYSFHVIDCIAESSCVRGFVVDGGGCAAAMAMCVR